MTDRIVWVRPDVVEAIHRRQLAEHGGASGVRDAGALASALERPKNRLVYANPTPDLASLAAAYGFGITRNHPFVDGNKRTALVVMRLFLRLNGAELTASAHEKYTVMTALAAGEIDEPALADWMRRHTSC
ncbi:MAG TPA: type II toxin-antitoxin system death-on-curing family toxin [Aliiroseovarius sp.]|nr:type II toxin-antitoxin system death-on-curing family toxin [Aliiroseovarius sp.]